MPKKNFLAFIVISALIVSGWWWVRFYVLEQPRPQDPAEVAQKKDGKDLAKAPDKAKEQPVPKDESKSKSKDEDKTKDQAKDKEATPPPVPEGPAKVITLGDPKSPEYFVLAWVNARGAGIQKVILPKFQKADEDGQPVFDKKDGKPTPFQLVEDDPIVSSFLLNHYPVPSKEECVATLGQKVWKLDDSKSSTTAEQSTVVLYCDQIPGYPELRITKTYTLKVREYHIGVAIEIRDERSTKLKDLIARSFRYQLTGPHGLPIEGSWYSSIYRSPAIGILDGRGYLWRDLEETQHRISVKEGGDRIPLGNLATDSMIQYAGVLTQYFAALIVVDNEQPKPKDILAYCRPTLDSEEIAGIIERVDFTDGERSKLVLRTKEQIPRSLTFVMLPNTKAQYIKNGLKPEDRVFVNFYKAFGSDRDYVATGIRLGNVRRPQLDDISVSVVSNILEFKPGDSKVHKFLFYLGPSKVRSLGLFSGDNAVSPDLVKRYSDDLHLRTLTDYHGWLSTKVPLLWMWSDLLILTTRFMHWLLNLLHMLVPNYGLTIIVLTLIVRGGMFPISRRSAMVSQRMQALAPEIKKVQEKYKNDPQAKTAAVMELYRKQGVSPFGSCLPMLMQLPIFLGLYYCLQESIQFRLASFLWMDNLAAPDMLFHWGNGIPIISDPDNMTGSFFSFLYLGPYFNILPVIAVVLVLVQQKLMTPPPADEQQEMQQKMMKYMMVFMGIMFYKMAAGLCVYFIVSSAWGLAERKMLPKKTAAAGGNANLAVAPTSSASTSKANRGKPKKEKKPEGAMQKMKDWWEELLKQAEKK